MSFRDVFGQERAKRFLQRLIRTDKIPHALLFSGLEGIGKATLARQFAKLLNCPSPVGEDACDACISCRKADRGIHPDLLWIKSERASIKVAQVREIKNRLQFSPFEGRWRVIVIEDAQELRDEAGNALLKILEEPPKRNVFLLTTPEPRMLLPTIVSRCCHIRLQPVEPVWIERYLAGTCDLPEQKIKELALLAEGSLERARYLADPVHLSHLQAVTDNLSKLDSVSMHEFFALTAGWAQQSQDLEHDLEWIRLWIRDQVLWYLTAEHQPLFRVDPLLLEKIRTISTDDLVALYFEAEQAQHDIRRNANKQLVLESVCMAIKERFYGSSNRNPLP
jgi:DNA polymerase III subunit delta'